MFSDGVTIGGLEVVIYGILGAGEAASPLLAKELLGQLEWKKWFGLSTLSTHGLPSLRRSSFSPDVTTFLVGVTQPIPVFHWSSQSISVYRKYLLMHDLGHIISVVSRSHWVFWVLQQTSSSWRLDRG